MNTKTAILGLDLAMSLAERLVAVVAAMKGAAAAGRADLSPDELQRFVDADDAARQRLEDRIAAARRRPAP